MYCPQICYSKCFSTCPAQCCSSAQQGVYRDGLAYTVGLPCPIDCYSRCHDNCPSHCCKVAGKRNLKLPDSAVKILGKLHQCKGKAMIRVSVYPGSNRERYLWVEFIVNLVFLCILRFSKNSSAMKFTWYKSSLTCLKMEKDPSGNDRSKNCSKEGVLNTAPSLFNSVKSQGNLTSCQ